jgi:prophage maintenance system killer protein
VHGEHDDHDDHDAPDEGERAAHLREAIAAVLPAHARALELAPPSAARQVEVDRRPVDPGPRPRSLPELLRADEVRTVHEALAARTGVDPRVDLGRVDRALAEVDRFLADEGLDLFGAADLFETAARLLPALADCGACAAPLRTALAATLALLHVNGFVVEVAPDALAELARRSAAGEAEPLEVQDALRAVGRPF